MKLGKHINENQEIKRLNKIISEKERKIHIMEMEFSDVLLEIRTLNESNTYGNESVIRRKISELCTNTRYELLTKNKLSSNVQNKR